MKRPSRVKIVGKTHVFAYVPDDHPSLKNAEGVELLGCIDHDRQQIAILDAQTLEAEQDVILHEVMHGVERAMDLDVDESVIQRLATGLIAVIKDNPGFVRYLATRKK